MLEPVNKNDLAFIFEFKVLDPDYNEKTLDDSLQSALRQIHEKNYDAELIARGVPKDKIRHYGFAFEGKSVLVGTDNKLRCNI